jgi:hypothetical protein
MDFGETFKIQTIAFHSWPLKAHVYLTMQNTFTPPRILNILTFPVLLKNSSPNFKFQDKLNWEALFFVLFCLKKKKEQSNNNF